MGLKNIVHRTIIIEVLRSVKKNKEWKVLVVDQLGMRIISSCCSMYELVDERVTLVEDLLKKREPLQFMEAIYFISPTEESIRLLTEDFLEATTTLYRRAHVFFTYPCPDEHFTKLCESSCAKYIKTLKEVNIAFIPYESQVFSLDIPKAFKYYFNPFKQSCLPEFLERIAIQIATVCQTLGEHPSIRYQKSCDKSLKLAQLVQQKLDDQKDDKSTMDQEAKKSNCQLLILDRSFDCVSPLLHELTFQAMAYDLLDVTNDIYKYESTDAAKNVFLDNDDDIWCLLKHKHIADVTQIVSKNLKQSTHKKRVVTNESKGLKDLLRLLKKMPEYQKEANNYSIYFQLAEDCMKTYNGYVDRLCRVEQDLAIGTDITGEKIKDAMFNMVPLLIDETIRVNDKIRMILLYILSMNGISEENLAKLIERANIPLTDKDLITNLAHLGPTVISDNGKKEIYQVPTKDRHSEQMYQLSRWTPVVKDLLENIIDEKLDKEQYKFFKGEDSVRIFKRPIATSVRFGKKQSDSKQGNSTSQSVPKIIVFIIGGMTYSEMRCCYEVITDVKNSEVVIGSDHILTPEVFLKQLRELNESETQ